MTDRVLTDKEVDDLLIANMKYQGSVGAHPRVRAIEAAVLAKMSEMGFRKEIPLAAPYGFVTEREARKREREAWDAGAYYVAEQKDRRYPIPTVKKHRTVTLSDGTTISKGASDWYSTGTHVYAGAEVPWRFARTPADARVLADLVENPYEEVPE